MGFDALLKLGLKAVAGEKAEDIQKGVTAAAQTYKAVTQQAPQPAQPQYDVPTQEMIQATKAAGYGDYAKTLEQAKLGSTQLGMPTRTKEYYALKEGLRAGAAKVRERQAQKEQYEKLYGNFIDTFQTSDKFKPDYTALSGVDRDMAQLKFPSIQDDVSLFQSIGISQNLEELRTQATQQYEAMDFKEQNKVIDETIDKMIEEQQKHYDEWMAESIMSGGGARANRYWFNSPVRKYTATAGAEREELLREALIDVPGSTVRGAVGALTVGLPDVLGMKEIPRQEARYKENIEYQDTVDMARAIWGAAGIVAGSFVTYGAIATRIQSLFGKMAKLPGRIGRTGK
jgi:hypothetical protein